MVSLAAKRLWISVEDLLGKRLCARRVWALRAVQGMTR